MASKKLWKDSPKGILQAGKFRGDSVWHSDDGGQTWWSGWMFPHTSKVTTKELIELAVSILREVGDGK